MAIARVAAWTDNSPRGSPADLKYSPTRVCVTLSIYSLYVAGFNSGTGLPRRRERLAVDPSEPEQVSHVVVARHDPAEIRFYIKQLKKAMRYLPLGSRAYYAVSGELLRANRELKYLVPAASPPKSPTQ